MAFAESLHMTLTLASRCRLCARLGDSKSLDGRSAGFGTRQTQQGAYAGRVRVAKRCNLLRAEPCAPPETDSWSFDIA